MSQDQGFFRDVSPAVRDQLRRAATVRSFAAGDALFREDDPSHQLLLIEKGRVRVWRSSGRGSSMTMHVFGPGALPGFAAFVREARYPATATAIDEVQVLSWPAERAFAYLAAHSSLMRNALTFLAECTHDVMQLLHDVANHPVEARLARAVLREIADRDATGDAPAVHGTRQDLAETVGTTLFTVSRIISRWEQGGLVRAHRGRIVVLQPEALRRIGAANA